MSQEKRLSFNLSGNELKDNRYNLHFLTEGLFLSQRLMEQAYLITANKSIMTKRDREIFKVYIGDIREGSFETDILIFMQTVSATLITGYSGFNPRDIWLLVVNSLQYLKSMFKANKKGEIVKVEINNSPNSVVNVSSDGNVTKISTNQDVVECANRQEPIFRRVLNMIGDDSDAVTSFNLFEKHESENKVHLGNADKELFKNDPILEDVIIEFVGKISTANFENMSGKIYVIDPLGSGLENKDYNFSFIESINENVFRKSCSMDVTVKALRKVKFNSVKVENDVISLKVISFQ